MSVQLLPSHPKFGKVGGKIKANAYIVGEDEDIARAQMRAILEKDHLHLVSEDGFKFSCTEEFPKDSAHLASLVDSLEMTGARVDYWVRSIDSELS